MNWRQTWGARAASGYWKNLEECDVKRWWGNWSLWRWTRCTLPPSGADRIGGKRNCGVGFTGSSREGKVWPLRKMIAPGTNSLTNWTPNMATLQNIASWEWKENISFLGTHFEPGEALQYHSHPSHHLASCILQEKVVDWGSIIGELVHRFVANTKRGQPSYIGHFLFHVYTHGNLLTDEEESQWTGHQIMREFQTTD